MNASLKNSRNGQILCARQGGPLLVRAMGLPFLAIGAYIGYYLVTGLYSYIRYATAAEWLEGLLAFFFMTLFTGLFLIPGLLVSFGAGINVIMDRNAVTVTSREGMFPWSEKQILKFEELDNIGIRSEESRTSKRSSAHGSSTTKSTWLLHVRLRGKDKKKSVLLGTFLATERDAAEAFAQRVGKWLGLEVTNAG